MEGTVKRYLQIVGLGFVAPFFLFLVVFQFYPIINTLMLSFTNYDGLKKMDWVGLKNYADLIVDKYFWLAFFNTWRIWLPNILMQLALAFLVAFFFTDIRYRIKGISVFRAVYYFPNLVTAATIALLINVLLDWKHGALNQILFAANEEAFIDWFRDPVRTQFIVSIVQTWLWFGYTAIILTTGIQGIPKTYYEAAYVDGATAWQVFWSITMPLLAPVITFVLITSLIGGMQIFDIPYILRMGLAGESGQAVTTTVIYLYDRGFRYHRMGYAASVAWVLFFLIVIFSLLYFVLAGRENRRKR